MAVLDAWAYGLPVITTPVGGIPEVALDGENMILFNPDDFQYLAQKLKQLIMNQVLQTKLSKAALSFANNQFSLKRIESDIRKIYESCFKL